MHLDPYKGQYTVNNTQYTIIHLNPYKGQYTLYFDCSGAHNGLDWEDPKCTHHSVGERALKGNFREQTSSLGKT